MTRFQIPDIRDFTKKLFIGDSFDFFLVSRASFITGTAVTLDGALHKGYFTDAQWEELEQHDLAPWPLLKPLCFQIIKGSRLPEQFSIVFSLPRSRTERLLAAWSLPIDANAVGGLFFNIFYERGALFCTTGVSFSVFIPDHSLEQAWDRYMGQLLSRMEIPWEE